MKTTRGMGMLLIFVYFKAYVRLYIMFRFMVCGTSLSILTDCGADTRKHMHNHPSDHFILYFPLLSPRSTFILIYTDYLSSSHSSKHTE